MAPRAGPSLRCHNGGSMQHAKERQRDRPEADRHGAFPGEPAVSELKCALVYPLPLQARY